MSRDLVIRRSAELEEILTRKFGAQGSGLGQKAMSVEHLLPYELSQKLKYIVSIRNKAAHEIEFQLRDRDRFCRICDEAKTMLDRLSVPSGGVADNSSASTHSAKTAVIPRFFIRSDLARFKCILVPYLLTTSVDLSAFTGRVIRFKERTLTIRRKNSQIDNLEQKIWLQLDNGMEDYIELLNFSLQAREGHHLTFLMASRQGDRSCLVVYIHELNRYFWNTNSWGKVLLGIHMLPRIALIYFLYFTIGLPILGSLFGQLANGPTFWIVAIIIVPIGFCSVVKSTIFKRFEGHIGKIFGSPQI